MTEWTPTGLKSLVTEKLDGRPFVVVANRQPYEHYFEGEEIRWQEPASGVTTALDPILRAAGGTWVGHGGGDADRAVVDADDVVRVPPDAPAYALKRVWLSKEEEDGYYYGFANQALWPLCHIAHERPTFNDAHWSQYAAVNAKFADAVAQVVDDGPSFVFVQDYHYALLPRQIKERRPNAVVAQFWHIPWPNAEAFRICPWKKEILEGLLGNDLLGFHIQNHCNNFLNTIDREMEARLDRERFAVYYHDRPTYVRPFPISVDFDGTAAEADSPAVAEEMKALRRRYDLGDRIVGVGIDRMDYTKGIPERLTAIDRFLTRHPEQRGKFVFIQVGVPSRVHIPAYKALGDRVEGLVDQINWRHRQGRWRPIVYLPEHHGRRSLTALYRLARFCMVTSLHDGMNLVAKEFIASRTDGDGVLVLSRFTGAAEQLDGDALLVNPYATDALGETIAEAVAMPEADRRRRMAKLREQVAEHNVYRWAGSILEELTRIGKRATPAAPPASEAASLIEELVPLGG